MKYNIQEEIGQHFLDQSVQLAKEGKTFVFLIDNIDWMLKVYDMRSNKQTQVFVLSLPALSLIV